MLRWKIFWWGLKFFVFWFWRLVCLRNVLNPCMELIAKENSKLSLWRSKEFQKKTVESLRATPLALLRLLLKKSDRLVLIVCVMFKNQDFLSNDLESIYALNKLRGSQVYHFYQYLSPSLKNVFSFLLTSGFPLIHRYLLDTKTAHTILFCPEEDLRKNLNPSFQCNM